MSQGERVIEIPCALDLDSIFGKLIEAIKNGANNANVLAKPALIRRISPIRMIEIHVKPRTKKDFCVAAYHFSLAKSPLAGFEAFIFLCPIYASFRPSFNIAFQAFFHYRYSL